MGPAHIHEDGLTDLRDIAAARDRVVTSGTPAVLATVVKLTGSAFRGAGARLLVFPDDTTAGGIGAGCLDRDVVAHAEQVRGTGEAKVVTYDLSADDLPWGIGMRCGGHLSVLLEPLVGGVPDHLDFLIAAAEARRVAVLATVFRTGGGGAPALGSRLMLDADGRARGALVGTALEAAVLADARAALETSRTLVRTYPVAGGEVEVLVECTVPPIALLVCGEERDAGSLVSLGEFLGWEVRLLGRREAPPPLDERSAAVLMTHSDARDAELLPALLGSAARYVGLVGSRSRTALLLAELRKSGAPAQEAPLARLHTPAGLDIGAETPAEVALAIVAEIQAAFAGHGGGPLRESKGRIHDDR